MIYKMGWAPTKPQIWGRKSIFLHTLVCISFTVFCLYSVQELAVEKIEGYRRPPPIQPYLYHEEYNSIPDQKEEKMLEKEQTSHTRNVWITMGLCWGENAKVHGKQNFPYTEAAARSIPLWHKLTEGQVILQIVYSGNRTDSLEKYRTRIQDAGARVILSKTQDLSCVLTAQLIRLLAFDLEFVARDDIIITADVDAFIMTEKFLLPLSLAEKNIWIWRYELTYNTGYTFMMPFIGAYSKIWREMLWYNGSLSDMVKHYSSLLNFKDDYTWDVDQHIVSRSILESGFCSVPSSNSLWSEVNLEPKPERDDNCWHGSGIWEDCNNKLWTRNAMIRFQGKGCKWWHFYPEEGVNELEQKFREIMSSPGDTGLVSTLLKGAHHLKKTYMDPYMSVENIPREDPSGELKVWSDHKD
ncbi:uncharacterized protein LOC111713936 isoform X2 [Eurytemora carolleeae]|uniref:uncharacterized protein LOC111713936 isoform X2 n=1 Tax=Eurytemora carolleeae TaxID=1294199 RepID=UPI000C791ED2|nr:uncharacterized protein LOC111713936 isoform X2 [Eurytemora carolleeae]|eukprot:XP_023344696.1 uncharacterized protein LOC111713936 isoform X2 [Eurytemora affinis]